MSHPRGAFMIFQDTDGRIHVWTVQDPSVDIDFEIRMNEPMTHSFHVKGRGRCQTFESYDDFRAYYKWAPPDHPPLAVARIIPDQ